MPKVLIVDDSLSVRRALERVLSAEFDVVAARSGEEALERFATVAPELVIADVIMPGIGGFELCRRLRELRPQTPVILISGVGDAQIEAQAQAVGAAAVIPKPFSPEVLRAALGSALRPPEPVFQVAAVEDADFREGKLQDVELQDAAQQGNRQHAASEADAPDLLASLTRFLEKPEVLAASLSDRQGACVAHVGERPTDAPTLASYSRFLLVASDVLGAHFGAEHTDGIVLEFPQHALYLSRVDARRILSLRLSDAGALSAVRYLTNKILPDLAAGLRD